MLQSGMGARSFSDVGSVTTPLISVIPSAATIRPTSKVTRITGNTNISTILPPDPYFNGPLYLLNTDATVGGWDAAGNIALAGTFTRYKLVTLMFDPSTGKWYTS